MVTGLLILNSSINGARDLWWPHDRRAVKGYNLYRAFDGPYNWKKLNETPLPGTFFRDQTTLQTIHFNVGPSDWIDEGEFGMKVVKLPDMPYSEVKKGRPTVAGHPDDVQIQLNNLDGTKRLVRPLSVSGIDQTVFLSTNRTLGGHAKDGETGLELGDGPGAVSTFPVIDFDLVESFTIIYRKLLNYVDIFANMVRTFYTVVPLTDRGEEHEPGAIGTQIVDSNQVDRIDYMQAEMVRRNQWLFEQVGEPSSLFLRRTSGERCHCNSDFTEGRTACEVCFETGIIGGYYGPIDMLFIDPDVAAIRTIDEGGKKVERKSRTYLGRTPIVEDGDLIFLKTGERLVISGVTYKRPRGVLLQQDFDVSLLPPKDTRYLIPTPEPANPLIYNPTFQPNPGHGAQPVTIDLHSENPDKQAARTTTFNRIKARGGSF